VNALLTASSRSGNLDGGLALDPPFDAPTQGTSQVLCAKHPIARV
jgi:hypothetical protein